MHDLINYCISEVAYSIYKFWLKNINSKIKGTYHRTREIILLAPLQSCSELLYNFIQTANKSVRKGLEYLCEKLNKCRNQTSLNTLIYFGHYSVLYLYLLFIARLQSCSQIKVFLVYIENSVL